MGLFLNGIGIAGLAALTAVEGCAMTAGATPDAGEQIERPLIALVCPGDIPDARSMCTALQVALGEAAPGHVIRVIPEMQAPARPGDMALELHVTRLDSTAIEGRLEWQRPGDTAPIPGPPITFGIVDTEISPHLYPRFIDGLLRASDLPLPEK